MWPGCALVGDKFAAPSSPLGGITPCLEAAVGVTASVQPNVAGFLPTSSESVHLERRFSKLFTVTLDKRDRKFNGVYAATTQSTALRNVLGLRSIKGLCLCVCEGESV